MEVEFSTVDIDPKLKERKFSYDPSLSLCDVTRADEKSKQTSVDGEAQDGSESDNNAGGGGKKKRRRSKRHKGGGRHYRKWKPYYKLTWPERKELEDRETERANLKREEAFASGHPVAPYNTTQFLIDDHINCEASPDLKSKVEEVRNGRPAKDCALVSGDGESSDEHSYESPDDGDTFLAKEFSETYENIHAENLHTMSKEALVADYLEMERKVEYLERKLARSESPKTQSDSSFGSSGDDRVATKRILEENRVLRNENFALKRQVVVLESGK